MVEKSNFQKKKKKKNNMFHLKIYFFYNIKKPQK